MKSLVKIISEEIQKICETTYKVYHGTNEKFGKFNFKNATQGIVWFTDSIDSIKNQEHGGQGNKYIMTRYITINNPAGWKEYEKYGLQQLQDMGYDGVILPQDNKTDYFVFSNKSISAKQTNLSENEILTEGLSSILYHFTYINNLISILKYNKFATSSNLGSTADSWKDKGRFYFFSTQRTKGMSGYARHHGNVAIVLDGHKLNYNFKGFAIDYWNWSKKRSDYSSMGDYSNALQSEENEDRIVTNKPYIDDASKYIIEIHILINPDQVSKEILEEVIQLTTKYNIQVFFYIDENAFKLQNKTKAVDPNNLNLQPKEKSEYDVKAEDRELYNVKWFFKKIAPVIIAKNDMNDGYNDERDAIEKLIKSMLENTDDSEQQYENLITDINEKIDRVKYEYYADDEYNVVKSEIHNNRGNPNPYLRELLKMLITDMKKWRVKNLKEYFNKKFNTSIKENQMKCLVKIISEEIQKFEGVADKYAEKTFHIPDPNTLSDLKAKQGILGKPFTFVGKRNQIQNIPIYKNPQSLEEFDADVRGILMNNGDLYVMQVNVEIMHGRMGEAIGLEEVYKKDNIVLLNRVEKENAFGLSDSGIGYAQYNIMNWKNTIKILRAGKRINPNIDFYPQYFYDVDEMDVEPVDANGNDKYQNSIFDNQ